MAIPELSPLVTHLVIAAVTLATFLVFARGARGQAAGEVAATRIILLLILVVPFLIATWFSYQREIEGPPQQQAAKPDKPIPEVVRPELGPGSPAPTAPPASVASAPPPAAAPPPSPPSGPPVAPVAATPAPPPPPPAAAPAAPPKSAETVAVAPVPQPVAPGGGLRGGGRPAETAAARPPDPMAPLKPDPSPAPGTGDQAQPRWDVVPVFYGTDRKAEHRPERADYGPDRAKRLEVGRALVTVPKTHEVPNVERPWVYRLPFTQVVLYREREDPARHFTLKEVKALSREQLIAQVRERLGLSRDYKEHALVFIHGFNNTFDAALYRTAQIAYDLQFDGAPFLYSWPSKGQLGVQDYSYDRESTEQAEPFLKEFLELVTRETGAKSVSVIAHSMGNQLLLKVLRELRRSKPDDVVLSQVILAAPDVDRDAFEVMAKAVTGVGRGFTLLAASNDRALDISRRFWGGVPRAGDVPPEGPVVVSGIDTIDVTAVSTDVFALNHSGYAERPTLLNDIRLLIQTGERPPEKRIPILARVKSERGEYWRYPPTR